MSLLDTCIHSAKVDRQGTNTSDGSPNDGAVRPLIITPVVRERRLRRVVEMIQSQGPYSVRDLAAAVRLSPAHLQRLFKHETGLDLSTMLAESRLQHAARLLSSSDLQIKEIAHAAGYEHQSSFARAFQRRFAQAPSCYRQQSDRG